jgi:hypothetical protein
LTPTVRDCPFFPAFGLLVFAEYCPGGRNCRDQPDQGEGRPDRLPLSCIEPVRKKQGDTGSKNSARGDNKREFWSAKLDFLHGYYRSLSSARASTLVLLLEHSLAFARFPSALRSAVGIGIRITPDNYRNPGSFSSSPLE